MKTAIIITTFNRPNETEKCFNTIRNAEIVPGTLFIIVDDKSTDAKTLELIWGFNIPGCHTIVITNPKNSGIYYSLLIGYRMAFDLCGCEIVMNLDNDTLVNNYFQIELLKLKAIWQKNIVTGFNCQTKNRDGSERHKMTGGGEGFNYKESVGGINMVLHREQYEKYMLPALNACIEKPTNWDALTCKNSMTDNKRIVCLQPSVIQHQGTQSSMGHNEPPDYADDFKGLTLPNVTLVCIDDNGQRGYNVLNTCLKDIKAPAILITNLSNNVNISRYDAPIQLKAIPPLGSKEAYSHFIIHELFKYVETSHVLIVQHDGYVKNWQGWRKEFLNYDYIGACWGTEYEPYRVGNGGFSLRSQKLCRVTAGINPGVSHPEDAVICRELRPLLESEHGIKFAPVEVAEKFSFEGYNQYGTYNGQFGFHGERAFKNVVKSVITSNPLYNISRSKVPNQQGLIFNQFLGLGDILFLVPLARYYASKGHDIIWPVADEYQPDLKRHFPDIQFVLKSRFPMDYERRDIHMHRWQYGTYKVLPFRWNGYREKDASDFMCHKYTMVGEDWKMWRNLKWERNLNKEFELAVEMGCTNENECNDFREYELHCQSFGCQVTAGAKHTRATGNTGLPRIALYAKKDYSMLDWALIMENATIIHAVSSSTLYMLETLNLKAKEIHLYGRNQGMKDHDYVRPIRTKNYILHP